MRTALETLGCAIGKGLIAGFAGTASMTASSTAEAKIRGRPFSGAPARATAKALGIKEFEDDRAKARFSDLSHWGYGSCWGIMRGLLASTGMSPRTATILQVAGCRSPTRSRCSMAAVAEGTGSS